MIDGYGRIQPFYEPRTRLTPRAADGAIAPLDSVGLPASAHSSQAALPIRPAANAFR